MKADNNQTCHCCLEATQQFAQALVLGKYPVQYYRCVSCGFIQTEAPFWLEECYSNPMTSYDLGGVSRPTANSVITAAVLSTCFNPKESCLDFGGGYGVFTRWMRDLGYDFWHHDKHCPNLFANGFDADTSGRTQYELVTAFEVFEHFADPASMVESIFQFTDSIFFTTDLIPEPVPTLEGWHYFGPEHGQHLSFYTPNALRRLAARFGARYIGGRYNYHLLTRRSTISPKLFHLVLGRKVRRVVNYFTRRSSLLQSDVRAAMMRAKQAAQDLAQTEQRK